jgi:predicted transcriptional regulator of viral defense system
MSKPTKRKPARRESVDRSLEDPADVRGLVRSRDLESRGASRVAIRRMVDKGELRQLSRGLYAASAFEPGEHHGLAAASALVPGGVVCLLSSLLFHGLSAHAPLEVWLAIDRKARKPAVTDPPLKIVRFSPASMREGVEKHDLEGVAVRMTSASRTVADCFKYRNKIGIEVALEALRAYRRTSLPLDDLTRAARVTGIWNIMRPYLEAMTV